MNFSITAQFSGLSSEYEKDYYIQTTYNDIKNACNKLKIEYDETEPGDTEYKYLSSEHGYSDTDLISTQCRYHDGGELPKDFWLKFGSFAQDLTINTIVNKEKFIQFIDEIGAVAKDIKTMGTLGGPLNPTGLQPDISFNIDSQFLISTIRVTPFPSNKYATGTKYSAKNWNKIRRATISQFGN